MFSWTDGSIYVAQISVKVASEPSDCYLNINSLRNKPSNLRIVLKITKPDYFVVRDCSYEKNHPA